MSHVDLPTFVIQIWQGIRNKFSTQLFICFHGVILPILSAFDSRARTEFPNAITVSWDDIGIECQGVGASDSWNYELTSSNIFDGISQPH